MNLSEHVLITIGCVAFYLHANWLILTGLVVRVSLSRAFYRHAINGNFSRVSLRDECDLLASFDGGSRRHVMILLIT